MNNKTLPVEQVDRDAAALALGYRNWEDATDYRLAGWQDRQRDLLVQAFARHRIQIAEAVKEACAKMAESYDGPRCSASRLRGVIASAIRNLDLSTIGEKGNG